MKHGKRPTRRQKVAIAAAELQPDNWLVTKVVGNQLHIVHRKSYKERIISQ